MCILHMPRQNRIQVPEKALGLAKMHKCLQLEDIGLTYTRMISVEGMWPRYQQYPLQLQYLLKCCLPWWAPPTRSYLHFCLAGPGLCQEDSRSSWDVEGPQVWNPMTGLIALLSPTKYLSIHLKGWLSLVMLGIFKTKFVKFRFQH